MINSSHEITLNDTNQVDSFDLARPDSNRLWKKIHGNSLFEGLLQGTVWVGSAIIYTAVLAPVSILVTAISFVGLLTLGVCSPALLYPTTAKIWKTAKNKIFGVLTDMVCLPQAAMSTHLAFKPNISAKENGSGPIVIFVHGFLHNKTCWESLIYGLKTSPNNQITDKDIYSINLGEPLTTEKIDHYARYLATTLDKLRKNRETETLDVILDCHSMGGLVSARFALSYAKLAKVNVLRLIANGTPWHGTPMAHIGSITECGKEMLPDHESNVDITNEINNSDLKNKIVTIASKGDTVVPFNSAIGSKLDLSEGHKIKLKDPLGHLAMQYSYETQKHNIRLIEEALTLAKSPASI